MTPLESVLEALSKPASIGEIKTNLLPHLKKLEKSITKTANPFLGELPDGKDPLAVVDPTQASLGYLFLLTQRIVACATADDVQTIAPFIDAFTLNYDREQLILAPDAVSTFSKSLQNLSIAANQPQFALGPLSQFITRYAPPGVLTSLHAAFLQVVITHKAYTYAIPLLSQDVTDVDTSNYPLKYQDMLSYFYHGGLIHALLQNYSKSIDMFEVCICAPGPGVSAIQIDAYKHYLLVSLLAPSTSSSPPPGLPSYVSPNVMQACRSAAAFGYSDYVDAWKKGDVPGCERAYEKGREAFEKDHTVGLIYMLAEAQRRRSIKSLTDLYERLSLREIWGQLGGPSVGDAMEEGEALRGLEEEIQGMLTRKEIHGTITLEESTGETIVTFFEDPDPFNDHETVKRLTNAIEGAKRREAELARNSRLVEAGREFVQKAYNQTNGSGMGGMGMGGFGGGGDELDISMGGDGSWDAEDDD